MDNIKLIFFSPTGGTKKIVQAIASGISHKNLDSIDITKKTVRQTAPLKFSKELLIIGVPVYAGRVPVTALEYLRKVQADKCPAVIVAVYGGRDFEAALFELKLECQRVGIEPFAAAAFIAEHSFSTSNIKIEKGRPDEYDYTYCKEFSRKINVILKSELSGSQLQVPGRTVLKPAHPILPGVIPYTDPKKCTRCMKCVEVCPTDAIDKYNPIFIDKEKCIKCCACVKICPEGAITMNLQITKNIAETVNKSDKKTPEFFLSE